MYMRRFHRWFGTISGIFMIFIGLTGIALQVDLFVTGNEPPKKQSAGPPVKVELPSNAQMADQLANAVDIVRAERPELAISSIQLQFTGNGNRTVLGGNGPFAPSATVDATTGRLLPPPPPRNEGYHGILQDLHAGYVFGLPGKILSIVMGVSLVVLGVTGLVIYWDLFTRRSKGKKKSLFWK